MILRNSVRHLLRPLGKFNQINVKPVDCIVCIDLECTCDSPEQIYPMEIIEIACLKLDLKSKPHEFNSSKCPTFHKYVRPVKHPELTLFCQDLTGIMQSTVDQAEVIGKVAPQFINWLHENDLINDQLDDISNFSFASCGNFDINFLVPILRKTLFSDSRLYQGREIPIYFKQWINVKKTFVNHKGEWPKNLYNMMDILDEKPSGRLHSALSDCRNLAQVVNRLRSDGCEFYLNSRLTGK